jgi:hypothetical protein
MERLSAWAELFIVMKKTYTYITITGLLVAGIAASLWYAKQPAVTITYGTPTNVMPESGLPHINVSAPIISTTALDMGQTETVTTGEPREASSTCESVRITIESATYMPCTEGEVSVLTAMQEATKNGLVFSGREYPSLGFFVETINGKTTGNGYYWFLYINDESSSHGASQTLVRPGDEIEWRYKQSY